MRSFNKAMLICEGTFTSESSSPSYIIVYGDGGSISQPYVWESGW